jgi:hypothetical protein
MIFRIGGAGLLGVVVLAGCATTGAGRCGGVRDPLEPTRLISTADSTARVLRTAKDSQAVVLRQQLHATVDRGALLDACGRATTAADYRALASLAMQSGLADDETAERAYAWSRRAVVLDSADRSNWRLMARAWDQLQLNRKQPQWFGTAVVCARDRRCALAPVDTERVSDPQRVELGLPTLPQQRATVDSLNRARGRP